jgi:hypothetical protein
MPKKKKRVTRPYKRLGTRIEDYPEAWPQYERESLAAETQLAEQRQIKKLEKLFKRSK